MINARRLLATSLAASLALALAACSGTEEEAGPPEGDAIAAIPAPDGQQWTEMLEATEKGGYRMGNPDAPIKLIEFAALSCSHCADFAEEGFPTLRNEYVASGRVSYELRYFMLNPYDVSATLLATCGSPEAVITLSEQFWEWQPQMFANLQELDEATQQSLGRLPQQQLIPTLAQVTGMTDFFASRGIPQDQANVCLADGEKAKRLADQTTTAAEEFEVTGTPTFVINGQSVGSMNWTGLEAALQRAGAR